jgi:hypothetical protein
VPAEHRLWLHQHEVPPPVRGLAARHDPERPVAPPEPRSDASARGAGELLPQEQVLEHERLGATERDARRADEERHPVQHGTTVAHGTARRTEFSRCEDR